MMRVAMVDGGRCVDGVGERGAALQAAGLAHGEEPLDPAVAVLGLCADLRFAHVHDVAQRSLGGAVKLGQRGDSKLCCS